MHVFSFTMRTFHWFHWLRSLTWCTNFFLHTIRLRRRSSNTLWFRLCGFTEFLNWAPTCSAFLKTSAHQRVFFLFWTLRVFASCDSSCCFFFLLNFEWHISTYLIFVCFNWALRFEFFNFRSQRSFFFFPLSAASIFFYFIFRFRVVLFPLFFF